LTTLTCKGIVYYSPSDERAFFEWVARIGCISRVEGRGDALLLYLSTKRVSEVNLRELIALFRRYKVGMAQLAQLENPRNRDWFRSPNAFWNKAVFPRRSATLA